MKLDDIKEHDYVVYTELPYSDYANSLNIVVSVNGVLYPKPLCIEMKGVYIKYSDMENAIPIKSYFDENNWFPAVGYSEDIDPIEYMNKHWELGKSKNSSQTPAHNR